MPIPSKQDLERLGENLSAIEQIISGIVAEDVTTPAGTVHRNIAGRLSDLQTALNAAQSDGAAALQQAKDQLARYAAINYKGEWTTSTSFEKNDVWRDGSEGAFYIVPADYTSGATAAADIAAGKVYIHQPKDWAITVASVSSAAALTGMTAGQSVSLVDGGRSGIFDVEAGDFTAEVAADTLGGVYVAMSDDPTGATKCLVRSFSGPVHSYWFIESSQINSVRTFDLASQTASSITQSMQDFFNVSKLFGHGHIDYGLYGITSTLATFTDSIKITGDGDRKSILRATTAMTDGEEVIHINDCGFGGGVTAAGTSTVYSSDESGVTFEDFAVEGDLNHPGVVNGIRVSGRTDWLKFYNISLIYLPGYGLKLGDDDGVNNGYTRESDFYNVNIRRCGNVSAQLPALWITSHGSGDGTNQLNFYGLKCVFPNWKGVVLQNGLGVLNTRRITFYSPQIHGNDSGVTPVDYTLFTILGDVRDVHIYNIKFNSSGAAGWSMELLADGNDAKPAGGIVTGNITTGGNGINADACGGYKFLFDILSVDSIGFKAGTGISSPINFDMTGNEDSVTLDIDSSVARWVSAFSSKSAELPIRTEEISMGHASGIVPSITYNAGSPNSVLNRNPGSLCLNRSAVSQFSCDMAYLRGTGGSTTWRGVQVCVGSTTVNRPASPTLYQSYFDTTLGIPIWYNGTNWVDSTGATV